jgi:hypothetical protein
MTYNRRNHTDQVKAWTQAATQDLSPEQLIAFFEQALSALWTQGRATMSSFMMTAVLERVIFNSAENHPVLSRLKIQETGISFEEIRKSKITSSESELIDAFQLMIVEFISILGGLTNEVVTPALYSELSKVKLEVKLKAVPHTNGENHD